MPLGASFLTELRMCLMNFCVCNEPKQENNQLLFKWVVNTLRITWPEEESCLGLSVTTWIQYWFYKVRLTTSRRSVASYIISSAWKMSSIIYKPYSNYLGCVPFGESQNGFLILDLPDFAVERNVKSEIGFVTLVTFRQRVQYARQPLKKWRVFYCLSNYAIIPCRI